MNETDVIDAIDVAIERNALEQTIEEIISVANQQGATASSVSVSKVLGLSNTVRNQEIETLEFNQDFGFGITVYVGQQKGHASTSDTTSESIRNTVAAAIQIAKQTGSDPCAGLADAELMANEIIDLSLDHPIGLTPTMAENYALEAEQAMLGAGVTSDGVTFASHRSVHGYGNSHGFSASHVASRHVLSAVGLAKDDNGMQRDYYYTIGREIGQLLDTKSVGQLAAERTLKRLNSQPIKTGQYPVLLSPEISAGVIGHIVSALSGGKLYRKASFLLDSLAQQVLPSFVRIYEDPFLLKALGSRNYDTEGVTCRAQDFITDGVVSNYLLGSYSARKLGMQTTANAGGAHNLHISNTGHSQEELLQQMGTGVYITEVMGQGINLVTGDYSRGASGFWVEGGELKHPIEGITIAGNLKQMMMGIVAIGNDIPHYLTTKTGSILINEMTVAAE